MIEKHLQEVQRRFWTLFVSECKKLEEMNLSESELNDMRHRADELHTNAQASWRITGEIMRAACERIIERKTNES